MAVLEARLQNQDDAETYAVLETANKRGLSLSPELLTKALSRVRSQRTAKVVAYMLAQEGSPSSRQAVARHVADGGIAAWDAHSYLGAEGDQLVAAARAQTARRADLMETTHRATPGSSQQLEAIKALTSVPGVDVTNLLQQLASDWSDTVAGAAKAALSKRSQLAP